MQQELKSDGFDVKTVSVDRIDNTTRQQTQYAYFKTTMGDRRIEVYDKCDFLTEEVLGLERLSDGHIEHPDAGKSGSKDQIDAVVGALWNASTYADEYAYNYGENVNIAINVSSNNEAATKKEISSGFENSFKDELAKLYMGVYDELDRADEIEQAQRKEEYERYKDIADGIIII